MNLESPRYAGDPQLEAAYDNAPPLSRGITGTGVAALQEGMVDVGHELPLSMKSGAPDGIFGEETEAVVYEFQGTQVLGTDGLVGRETMGRLDELAGGNREGTPEIGDDPRSLGGHVASEMERLNRSGALGPERGVWYRDNYFAAHQQEPALYRWDDDWRSGYADPRYFDRVGELRWTLKPGRSASAAVREFLNGLTIAECACAIVAVELDAMRAALGDREFDRRHGSEGGEAEVQALSIGQDREGTPLETGMTVVGVSGGFGSRNLLVGDWVAFFNHPMYLLKHPGGDWQGENAVYTGLDANGDQVFTGLGAAGKTEQAMLEEMARFHNVERNGYDYAMLLDIYAADTPEVQHPDRRYLDRDTEYTRGLYLKYVDRIPAEYREDAGIYPDVITAEDILTAPPYELDGVERTGGFTGQAKRIDPGRL